MIVKIVGRVLRESSHQRPSLMQSFPSAYFLWKLENPKQLKERRFFKRYFTMWNIYNIGADVCFGVGLIMKLIEYIILIEYTEVS